MSHDTPTKQQWFFSTDGHRQGPYTAKEMRLAADSGRLAPDDMVWREGMSNWVKATRVRGLFTDATVNRDAQQGASAGVAGGRTSGPKPPQPGNSLSPETLPAEGPTSNESATQSKVCPICGESVLAIARKCKHCGEFIDQPTPGQVTFKVSPDFYPLAPLGFHMAYYFRLMDAKKKVLAKLWRNQEFSVDIPVDSVPYVEFTNAFTRTVEIKCQAGEAVTYMLSIPQALTGPRCIVPRCIVTRVDSPA